MPVNSHKSGSRLLAVIEEIARSQPIGARALASAMRMEKSAIQRDVTTLAEAGWIQAPAGNAGGWELSGKILHVAHLAHGSNSLRQRVRPILEWMRDRTGETAYLAVNDADGFIVIETAESHQQARLVVPVGSIMAPLDSAPGAAVLPYLSKGEQQKLLGGPPGDAAMAAMRDTLASGYCVRIDALDDSSISISAAIFDAQGQVVGAVVISAVRARISDEKLAGLGRLVAERAKEISQYSRADSRVGDLRRAIGSFG